MREFHQTDHRSAAEITEEAELSTLFALARIIGPRRMEPNAKIHYICFDRPPEFLAEAIASAGATLQVMPARDVLPYPGTARPLAQILDAAFAGYALRIADGRPLDEALLQAIEDEAHGALQEGGEDDERARWTGVMRIGAVVGELIRQRRGGKWDLAPEALDGTVPFAFACGASRLNVLGRAERFLVRGESQSARWLLASLADADQDRSAAPVLPVLKPPDWGAPDAITRPLLPGDDMPLIALARDLPNSVAYLNATDQPGDVAALHAQALANLAAIEVRVEEIVVGQTRALSVTGSWYASEKLLDEAFLGDLAARLGTPHLVCAAPYKGLLLVGGVDASAPLATAAAKLHAEPKDVPISPRVFVVVDGKVAGYATLEQKKPGFWKRLFGKN